MGRVFGVGGEGKEAMLKAFLQRDPGELPPGDRAVQAKMKALLGALDRGEVEEANRIAGDPALRRVRTEQVTFDIDEQGGIVSTIQEVETEASRAGMMVELLLSMFERRLVLEVVKAGLDYVTISEIAKETRKKADTIRDRVERARAAGELRTWRRKGHVLLVERNELLELASRPDGRGGKSRKKRA